MCGRLAVVFALVALVLAASVVASAYTVNITVIGPQGTPLAGVVVKVYDAAGNMWNATTDVNGVATFNLDNGTYVAFIIGERYAILDVFNVAGDTSVTIDATTMHNANLTSSPITVDVELYPAGFNKPITIATNTTLYAKVSLNATFPKEVAKLPYKYTLDKLEVNGTIVTGNSAILDLSTSNYNVVAHYVQSFAFALEPWMLGALIVVVALAILIVMRVSTKTAKQVIEEWRVRNARFVQRR